MKVTKASKMKIARELSYKTVTGLLPVLQRFADSLGVYDINELSDIICNMSVDEFCDFKFKPTISELESELDPEDLAPDPGDFDLGCCEQSFLVAEFNMGDEYDE